MARLHHWVPCGIGTNRTPIKVEVGPRPKVTAEEVSPGENIVQNRGFGKDHGLKERFFLYWIGQYTDRHIMVTH